MSGGEGGGDIYLRDYTYTCVCDVADFPLLLLSFCPNGGRGWSCSCSCTVQQYMYHVHMHIVQVDLAGSENIGRSGAADKRAREAGTTDSIRYIYSIYCTV